MIKVNDNFTLLSPSYLFSEIAKKVSDYRHAHPEAHVIRMGIGDVTRPVCPAAIEALQQAAAHEASSDTFHGYGPEQGYEFLREAIAQGDYKERGIDVDADEIFVSDGAKSDTGNIGDILSADCKVAVTDPVYPVYVDTNVMAGRAGKPLVGGGWSKLEYLPCTAENDFCPALPTDNPDVIYLCFPNNPTGTALTRKQLQVWVDYALEHGCLILFDSAYEAYVHTPDVPRSIYELSGARNCAIEFRSFSKTAGFTGLRCGYTVVPRSLMGYDSAGRQVSLHQLWLRRQSTKFNGASYPIQRAAAALYTPAGREQVAQTIAYYMENATTLREGLSRAGLQTWGGIDSPYIWVKTPDGLTSWEFFDLLLNKCNVVGTPGSGFGPSGEGYLRLTAFSSHHETRQAIQRLALL
ncbi:MAG: LL-diaminopimelate aminotransferase [Firmicutes bacterium]|nr:LL-diaminopimelate aminotransferase [Bacillota bacterium]MCM1401182.1 LL-diaminopimelate aminotransferase [Bacteroides sp.]MCM1477121.1 LL-diaminopimelate aminotransferase [Bacteroides sp.]